MVNSPNIGMKNGGGVERDGGENDVMDPRIGNGEMSTTGKLKSSTGLRKMGGGTRSKTRKGLKKKWGGSDSSQPGIRKFLLENENTRSFKISSNGNSPGNHPIPIKPCN